MIQPVILSGGFGSRLWPMSREEYPKQFQRLNSPELSLLQETALRVAASSSVAQPLVVCNEEHRFLVAEQLREAGCWPARILLEPLGRNTAPAVALAALLIMAEDPETLLLVMPADHVIKDDEGFRTAMEQGQQLAQEGRLVTFGVQPTIAHVGYGYIEGGEPLGAGFRVDAFTEKPRRDQAERYLERGNMLWNSGIFLFTARSYLEELAIHAPDIHQACIKAFEGRHEDLDFLRMEREALAGCPSDSIDYAVMEATREAAVILMDVGWRDIGAWDTILELKSSEQPDGNAIRGDVLLHDVHDSLVYSESRLVAAIGVRDLVIVETEDAVMVARRDHSQEIRVIVDALKAAGRAESQAPPRMYRPWGYYHTMVLTDRYRVKKIVVNPGARLSLQMHHHRAEHWVVVAGTARVSVMETPGDCDSLRSFLLTEDESTYIPLGVVHRLENPGVVPLKLIEVQTGTYLGEDDIVRFDDAYGRMPDKKT
ncbi:mannose-1-phosphate guanylyltransferase/mannose-6-phosphate isomerase [Halomonas sp.]